VGTARPPHRQHVEEVVGAVGSSVLWLREIAKAIAR
jgi:hypothetical protein